MILTFLDIEVSEREINEECGIELWIFYTICLLFGVFHLHLYFMLSVYIPHI